MFSGHAHIDGRKRCSQRADGDPASMATISPGWRRGAGEERPGERVGQGVHFTYTRLQTQTATTSISGSSCRTRFSIPVSVPEIELGQLPQAPW